jgi:hypothetical protein
MRRRRCVRVPTVRTISVMVVPSLLLLLLLVPRSRRSKRVEMSRLRGREATASALSEEVLAVQGG